MKKKSTAPAAAPPPPAAKTIAIKPLDQRQITVYIIGQTPLILHSMSNKARQQLLFPPETMNKVERESTLKHDPLLEFKEAAYYMREPGETLFCIPGSALKGALGAAALRTPGATKVEIGQLTQIVEESVPVWGAPYLHMATVRQSGINRAPDVRTRPIFPQWAARFTVEFTHPLLTADVVLQLLANAGQIVGVGDFRVEKGKGNYGRWRMVSAAEFADALKVLAGAKAQQAALDNPVCYDREAERLLTWFHAENERRQLQRRKGDTRPVVTNGPVLPEAEEEEA